MTSIPFKTLEVSPGITYRYLYSCAARADRPTLLFLHGFSSTATDFRPQLEHFAARGCGVLAPDLLGYGGTSKPADPGAYTWRAMAGHVAALLDAEGLLHAGDGDAAPPVVVGVGHDLGSWFLSRLCHLLPRPARLAGLAFLCVGYAPPGGRFDVEAVNRASAAASADGQERFRYWDFFAGDDDDGEATALMGRETEAAVSLMHAAPPGVMAANLGPRGAARAWVAAGRVASAHSFGGGNPRSHAYFRDKVAAFRVGGWTGPTNWYRALRDNLSFEEAGEEDMEKELRVPVLVVGCGRDEMTAAGLQDELTRLWARAGYRFEVLDAGHWVMLEDAAGTNRVLEEFVDGLS